LRSLAAAGVLATVARSSLAADSPQRLIYVFTKPLQHLSFSQAADYLQAWDVGGVEATVRSGGWIEPMNAPDQLPALVDELRRVDRQGMILTSDINQADHPDVARVLEVAAPLGVRYFRMAYYKYDFDKPILPQLDGFARQAQDLAKVCQQLKMTGLYQNHAGAAHVGAPLWDLMEVLQGIAPSQIAVALDIRHATIEATESWRSGYARLRDQVGAIFAKDAVFANGKIDDGPLGRSQKGKQLFQLIRADHPTIPISLHMEYLDHRKADLAAQRLEAIATDIQTLKGWLAE
jgi:sugar phosphate isomerase/epimerase